MYGGIKKTLIRNHKRFTVFTWLNTALGVKKQIKQLHNEGFHTAVIKHKLIRGTEKGNIVYVIYSKLNPDSWRGKIRNKKNGRAWSKKGIMIP